MARPGPHRGGGFLRSAWAALLLSGAAWAQAGADAGEPAPAEAVVDAPVAALEPEAPPSLFNKVVSTNGYLSSRTTYQRARVGGLYPTADLPQWGELLELNAQTRVNVRPHSFAYGDVSLVGQVVGNYRTLDSSGNEVAVPAHDVATARPLVSLNEFYVSHEFFPELNLLIGKKRITWGPGQAYNPTDLLNIRRDPTDPTFQRAGAWVAQLEVPLETMAFTVLFSPQVTEQASGIPYGMLTYPTWDQKDDQAHYLVGARAYGLVADTDLNLMAFFTNRYNDDFEKKLRFGGSVSRIFFTDWEVHFEGLWVTGSNRAYLDGACVASPGAAIGCVTSGHALVARSKLTDGQVLPQTVLGVRKQFNDDSMISVEWLYQADGYTRAQYQDLVNAIDLLGQANTLGIPTNRVPGANLLFGTSADGTPARFAFTPTVQHYLFATLQKPRLFDDFTLQLVLIANLQDLSTVWTPSVAWSATDWLSLTLYGFIPLRGPDSLAARVPSSGKVASEYGLVPTVARAVFEARVFY